MPVSKFEETKERYTDADEYFDKATKTALKIYGLTRGIRLMIWDLRRAGRGSRRRLHTTDYSNTEELHKLKFMDLLGQIVLFR